MSDAISQARAKRGHGQSLVSRRGGGREGEGSEQRSLHTVLSLFSHGVSRKGSADVKRQASPAENPELSRVSSVKPGRGQNIVVVVAAEFWRKSTLTTFQEKPKRTGFLSCCFFQTKDCFSIIYLYLVHHMVEYTKKTTSVFITQFRLTQFL